LSQKIHHNKHEKDKKRKSLKKRKFMMRYRINFSLVLAMLFVWSNVFAESNGSCFSVSVNHFQQGPGRGPIALPRDPELEKQSAHNLEVAKYYFYKRKPEKRDKDGWERVNKAVESRLLEIIDTNPDFARIDDVYFMLGELYKRTGDLDKAVENWTKVVNEFPDSVVKADAQKRLDETKSQNKEKKG
jgi:tetratricopeptide (TPR) repeat protein